MDLDKIEEIVEVVLAELGYQSTQKAERPQSSIPLETGSPVLQTDQTALPDLASEEIKKWVGIEDPDNQGLLKELCQSTNARVAVGRTGPRPRTTTYLRFLADQSLSRDTVFKEIPDGWVSRNDLFMVSTLIRDKDEYLTRPDRGRILSEEAKQTILEKCNPKPEVQIVLSDGLSTDALTANYEEILPALMQGFQLNGIAVGTPFFVKFGRVKVEDEIGELLGAEVIVLLIGERPGLGQSESMSAYMIYKPTVAHTVESDRTVISNIHHGGTPPVEASAVIVDIVKKMLEKKTSGIHLNK
ncbi:ethanolamine ammonia-lyase subunit EutC [candidate division CSSED10-310 bacterium]|uniref:Ethanolamine ammonia-lyase small subunit n=1 Tax=candidate division CSSED10-310 bacterium TaxID=2855610 RepID=A0ABV6YV32_UNCC1